jgi:hypothetical protein
MEGPKTEAAERVWGVISTLDMSEKRSKPPAPSGLNPALEAALDRWKKAAKGQGTREQRYTGLDTA